jgi:putative aldouronate transport system substrate-binding protein
MTSGTGGATFGYGGGTAGRYLTLMTGEDYSLGGIAPLKLAGGAENGHTSPENNPVNHAGLLCVSTINPYLYETLTMLDYGYGKEGHYLYNFGIEGVSYDMVDGQPVYTEEITKNADGLTMGASLGRFARSVYSGPMIQDYRYQKAYMESSGVWDIVEQWSAGLEAARATNHVYLATLTADQTKAVTDQQTAINTYWAEMFAKFVTGAADVDAEWDAAMAEVEKMGVQDVLKVRQEALDGFYEKWPDAKKGAGGDLTAYIKENFE